MSQKVMESNTIETVKIILSKGRVYKLLHAQDPNGSRRYIIEYSENGHFNQFRIRPDAVYKILELIIDALCKELEREKEQHRLLRRFGNDGESSK